MIHEAARRLNYPGANKLYSHLRAQGHNIKYREVQEYTERQPARQVFVQQRRIRHPRVKNAPPKPPNMNEGKFTAPTIKSRWMADLADLTAQPSISGEAEDRPFQYILVVLNVFSKELYAKPLRVNNREAVTNAFREILEGNQSPNQVDTDNGTEFTGPFQDLLRERGIQHFVKDQENANGLAPVDRVIGTLKRAIFRRVVADGNKNWVTDLQKTVDGYNETIHSALQGRPPEEVKDDGELQFALRRANSQAMVHNSAVVQRRDEKLQDKGAFRVHEPSRSFARSYQPRFGDKVHAIAEVKRGYVTDTEGKAFKSKYVLPVPAGSADAANTEEMKGGSAQTDRLRLEALKPFKDRLVEYIGSGKWMHEMAEKMKELGMTGLMKNGLNYKKSLVLLGFEIGDRGKVTYKKSPAESAAALRAPTRRLRAKTKSAAA